MHVRCALGALMVWLCIGVKAAPPLSMVEDTLYKADGSTFNGIALIEWKSFQAADSSTIAAHSLTVSIVNGRLRVRLVPTTNASPGAYYSVRYNSDGRTQFSEWWSVPPSSTALKLKDVRVSNMASTSSSAAASTTLTQITESDVVGLEADLAARPMKGPSYAPSRVVYVSETGMLEAVAGELTDCVRVDGTAGPCGANAGPGPAFVDAEIPSGVVDGANRMFILGNTPNPASSLALYRNGILQQAGLDYMLSGNVINFAAEAVPQPGDVLLSSYRVDGVTSHMTGYPAPEVICSSAGTSNNTAEPARLGSCTIAAGLLQPGDRVEIRFGYSHEGVTTGFAFEIRWGSTSLVSRTASASDSFVSGQVDAGLHNSGALWSAQSWGTTLAQAATVGNAVDSTSSDLLVSFYGSVATGSLDTVTLRNFTVIRYPAHTTP